MDPDHRLIEEVLFLHSLWRRGLPPTFHNHSAASEFASTSAAPPAITDTSLRPAAGASFKRKKKKKKKRSAVSNIPWPVQPSPPPLQNDSSWPEFPPLPLPTAAAVVIDNPTAAASLTQQAAVATCRNFFKKENISDNDDDEDEDDDEEAEAGAFKFFVKLFEEASALKCYYEKNWENGEFYCLVCVVTSLKAWKKFPGCVSLVQHASSITKTKRTKAHRAFAKVVCRLLAWDIKRLPSIVLDTGGTLSESLARSTIEQQGDTDDEGSPPPPVVI